MSFEQRFGFLDLRRPCEPGPAAPRLLLLSGLLLFTVQFQRGLWEPDEGRYAEVAREMLVSGDWFVPRLNGRPHLAKPPVTYWLLASSMTVFGPGELAARLPSALAAFLTVALVMAIAGRLGGSLARSRAGLVQATIALPHAAAHIVNPDSILVLFTTAGIAARVFEMTTPTGRRRDMLHITAWTALGLGFLTKGPPALLPALGLCLHSWLCKSTLATQGRTRLPARCAGFAIFLAVGLGWFALLLWRNPALGSYFLGDEVVGRIFTGKHRRHPEWYGMFEVYAPAVVAGCLPWIGLLPNVFKYLRGAGKAAPTRCLLLLVIALPLLAFCLARSRLHLYVLPIFPPLAVVMALSLEESQPRWIPGSRALIGWSLLLLASRLWLATPGWERDSRALWRALPEPDQAQIYQLASESGVTWGVEFYAGGRLERCNWEAEEAGGVRVPGFKEVARQAMTGPRQTLILVRERDRPILMERLGQLQIRPDIRRVSKGNILVVLPPQLETAP